MKLIQTTAIWFLDKGKSYLVLILCGLIAGAATISLFGYTRDLLLTRLEDKLIAISSTASLLFDEKEIEQLHELGGESVNTDLYRKTVLTLRKIKRRNSDIRYVYIFHRTDDPSLLKFVADADMIALKTELNFTGESQDESDFPGTDYDVTESPGLLSGNAFIEPTIDDLYQDDWGYVFSSYAPIRDNQGVPSDSIIGIDVDVTQYLNNVFATLIPFTAFIVALFILLGLLTFFLLRIWGSRVDLLKDLDRQKDELISIVSHQLATPVTSVKWYLEMLLDGDSGELNEEQKKQLMTMQGVTEDLVDLVGMILDVSRIQLGRMKVDRGPLDLGTFFTEVLAVIEPKATMKKQQFIKNIPGKLPVASLDKRLMRMTLENLLSNAVKYTPEGGKVELNVTLTDHTLRYEVKDTGCGIPKEDQEKIFGKLFRATNVRNTEGNGLGLFAAKGAAEAQGGKVWFESESGKGTTFTVEVPLEEVKEQE